MLKHFLKIMGRYLKPYRKYLVGSVLLNFFSQWMNVFSFVVLIEEFSILLIVPQSCISIITISSVKISDLCISSSQYSVS